MLSSTSAAQEDKEALSDLIALTEAQLKVMKSELEDLALRVASAKGALTTPVKPSRRATGADSTASLSSSLSSSALQSTAEFTPNADVFSSPTYDHLGSRVDTSESSLLLSNTSGVPSSIGSDRSDLSFSRVFPEASTADEHDSSPVHSYSDAVVSLDFSEEKVSPLAVAAPQRSLNEANEYAMLKRTIAGKSGAAYHIMCSTLVAIVRMSGSCVTQTYGDP